MAVYKVTVHSAPEPNQFIVSANNRKQAENTVKTHLCGHVESQTLKAEDVFNLSSDTIRLDANFKAYTPANREIDLNQSNSTPSKSEVIE